MPWRLEAVQALRTRAAIAVCSGIARIGREVVSGHRGQDSGPLTHYGPPRGPVYEAHIVLASYRTAVRPLELAPWVRPFAHWLVARGTIEPSGGTWRWVPDRIQHVEDVHDIVVDAVDPALLAGRRHVASVVRA